jgi:hypothetical protein
VALSLFISALSLNARDLQVPAQYETIQAAVDAAADGDTIVIGPGTYTEQAAIIHKRLNLVGKPGATLRAFEEMNKGTALGVDYIGYPILGIMLSDVNLSGLTFEGDYVLKQQEGGPAYQVEGVIYGSANGRIENCRFQGFRDLGGSFRIALSIDNYLLHGTPEEPSPDLINVAVRNCTFADNRIGILVIGDDDTAPEVLRTHFTVEGSTFAGSSPAKGSGNPQGILIFNGAAGEVTGNSFSDFGYIPPPGDKGTYFSDGISALDNNFFDGRRPGRTSPLPLQFLRIVDNTFKDNNIHLAVGYGLGADVINNRFEGTAPGSRPAGLALSGGPNQVIGNFFSKCDTGVILVGNDPQFGTTLGISHDTTLVGNRFCNVPHRINIEPLVKGTKESESLECPFPAPSLSINPAVTLTWPFDGTGYMLETAAAADGPWSPALATPAIANGRTTVSVAANAEHRFFRLSKP